MSQRAEQVALAHRIDFVVTTTEYNCIFAAAMALGVPVSLLLSTAALEAAHALGYYEGFMLPRRAPPGTWTDPMRGLQEAATKRFTADVHPLHHRTIERAAKEQLRKDQPAPVQAFMVGSTLRFIATLRSRAVKASRDASASPEDREVATAFLTHLDDCFQEVSQRDQVRFEVPGLQFMK